MTAVLRPLCVVLVFSVGPATVEAGDWPRFRGPDGTGVASAPGLPVKWEQSDYAWEVQLPGVGHSSPVIHGRRLFATTASDDGTERRLVCLDPASGKTLWTRGVPLKADKLHLKNSHASGSPAVTDEFVYVTFADDEHSVVAAFDLNGKPGWTYDLGPFQSQHGHGSSPIVWRDLVIVTNDQDGPSSLVALDARSGEVAWNVSRPTEDGNTSYSTPFVLEAGSGPPQLITSSKAMGIVSSDPATGRINWQSKPLPQRPVASPVLAGGVIFQSCGQQGRGTYMVGVNPFAKEDAKRVVFERSKELPYVPTPIAYGDHLYLWSDNGIVVCLDAKKGFEEVWTKRVNGNYSSSPICVNGLLYAVTEEGEVAVVRASTEFELLGRSPLGEPSHSTPAVADGRMFFRTFNKLLCLAPKTPAT